MNKHISTYKTINIQIQFNVFSEKYINKLIDWLETTFNN